MKAIPAASRHRPLVRPGILVCAILAIGAGCTGPLRLGQEVQTGGRTALTQWEVYDALVQMYQAQVLLNLVRLSEYGEAPLHFEFSDINATVTDRANTNMGLEFYDSPAGGVMAGAVRVANRDTNVRFTPGFGVSRDVQIQAKANPIIHENWIYEWYYRMADQCAPKAHPKLKLYEPLDAAGAVKAANDRRFGIWYKGTYFAIKGHFVDLDDDETAALSSHTPREEFGALTALLSFLQKSRPGELKSKAVVEADDYAIGRSPPPRIQDNNAASDDRVSPLAYSQGDYLYLHIARKCFVERSWLSGFQQYLAGRPPGCPLEIQIPAGPDEPFFVGVLDAKDAVGEYWQFEPRIRNDDAGRMKDLAQADAIAKALRKWRQSPSNPPILVVLPREQDIGNDIISASEAVRAVAQNKSLPSKKTEVEVLEEIKSALQRLQAQQ